MHTRMKARTTQESLTAAWQSFTWDKSDKNSNNSLRDFMNCADVLHFKSDVLARVESRTLSGEIRPSGFQIIDHPKDEINVRPLVRFSFDDHLIYNSIILQLSRCIESVLNRSVYSYRWRWDDKGFRAPIRSWLRMQRIGRYSLKKNRTLRMAKTDVVSFYDNVDLEILIDDINALGAEEYDSTNLRTFLEGFQQINHAWGLPQGPDASGMLANLYLVPIDNYLIRSKLRYQRYSDDVSIFSPDWDELRSVLLDINKILRARRLVMSATKTQIYEPSDALSEYEDIEKDALQYGIATHARGSADKMRDYFLKITDSGRPTLRDLRFALNRLGRLGDESAIDWALESLNRNPHFADIIFNYLAHFEQKTDKVCKYLVGLIQRSDTGNNAQLQHRIIAYFLAAELHDIDVHELAWSLIDNKNSDAFVREFAARYIGRHSTYGDGQRLKHIYESESDVYVRRALLVAMYECSYCPPRLLQGLSNDSTELRWTARYLISSPCVPLPRK